MASSFIFLRLTHPVLDSIEGRVEQVHRALTMPEFFAPQILSIAVEQFFRNTRPGLAENEWENLSPVWKAVCTVSTTCEKQLCTNMGCV